MTNNWKHVHHAAITSTWKPRRRNERQEKLDRRRLREIKSAVWCKVKRIEWMAETPGDDGLHPAMLEVFVDGERMTIATRIIKQEAFKKPIRIRLSCQPKPKKFGGGVYYGAYRFPEDMPKVPGAKP